jgi:hypothetical protein
MFVTVELLDGTQERRERKRGWYLVNNFIKHNICEGRGYKALYWKLLESGGRREGARENDEQP